MFRKFFSYPVFLILFLSFIGTMGFGAILKYHYDGGEKIPFLRKSVLLFAEVPSRIKFIIKNGSLNINKPPVLQKHKNKVRFKKFIENKRNAILILSRYDHQFNRSIVDVIDLENFETIHSYKHDIDAMNDQVTNIKEFPRLRIDNSRIRFVYQHPLLFEDGSLISMSDSGPAFRLDFCSNLKWINDEEIFHHSLMLDHEGNIWTGGQMNPKSKYVKKYNLKKYIDDSIIKINTDGKILYNKSVTEILIENNVVPDNYALNTSLSQYFNPIHLNDIEPAMSDTKYWKQGDLFLSVRQQNAIIHYRPENNKVINYINGPFARQHDVDIISDKEISIFNNNNFFINNQYSQVLIYNFETKKFISLFDDELKKNNFKTNSGGLSHTFKDGSLMVEEQNHGRIILFNKMGELEWEFINKDKTDKVGFVDWSRIVEDEIFIEKFKSLAKNKKCLN